MQRKLQLNREGEKIMTDTALHHKNSTLDYTVGETILKVQGVNKEFGGHVVLRDVNFEIQDIRRTGITQGQVFSILGKSGAGKTTVASIIAGLLKPTSGTVIGKDGKPIRQGEVGFVFQNYINFDHVTVRGNLLLSAYQGMFREEAADSFNPKMILKRFLTWIFNKKILWEKVEQYLDLFDLRIHVDKFTCELSGGQRQRLAVLCQVLCSSEFIIFDEPFSGQDPEMKEKACEMLIKTSQLDEYKTLGIITHDIDCAVWVSDKLLLMGKETDTATGKPKPGSTVFKPYDLAEHGLAWQDAEVLRMPQFRDLVDEIKYSWFPNM
ncbi:ABC transporter ATP-binding protein [Candidatus Jorgensenbacteria bacterium]|nr:ABC transporter ATP-binding protein [Candidatus Jorgensenbacteria bacterium]